MSTTPPAYAVFFALMMSTNSGLSDAPPTKKPSTSGRVAACRPPVRPRRNKTKQDGTRTELLAVRGVHAPAVDDAGALRDGGGDRLGEERARVRMRVLRLLRGRDLARADRPHGLVHDHDLPTTPHTHAGQRRSEGRKGTGTNTQSASARAETTAASWPLTISVVCSALRSASVSPTQRATASTASSAARVFCATSVELSPKSVRRSECPVCVRGERAVRRGGERRTEVGDLGVGELGGAGGRG